MNHTSKESLANSSQYSAYSDSYFDELYNDNTDPWQYQTRWYEERKRNTCLALLPQPHYERAIELGCGNGVLSELLAHRCQDLISIDGNHQAVKLAKERLAALPHARVIQGIVPDKLFSLKELLEQRKPLSENTSINQPPFDLIVISEILYYLSSSDIDVVINWALHNLALNGTLLCCHWRYAIDGFAMTGESVHQRLHQTFIDNNKNQYSFNCKYPILNTTSS
ncbi:class I SAM-dependent DNA methyltransferase [Psychrobacter sp. KCTC 72983]|uniref:class I SAM-dependent DNA methyltransferase n=1 Tax=Psychrobacter sp. KCTC 72983 TaxID=2733866 RepID=UPI0016486169|nr:class I SAM-dependent methyltransferase [Psychrobacter sp. KCTC 72983]